MSITIQEPRNVKFAQSIYDKIANHEIIAWQYDANRRGFTHVTHDRQWDHLAYMVFDWKDHVEIFYDDEAIRRSRKTRDVVYSVYHGRFIEMLLEHFSHDFGGLRAERYEV
jgi:hypothetical protein